MTARPDQQLLQRKARDRSIALLLIGCALLMPPIAGLSLIDGKIAGVPVPLLYLFFVWILLIAGAKYLSRPLRNGDETPAPGADAGPEN